MKILTKLMTLASLTIILSTNVYAMEASTIRENVDRAIFALAGGSRSELIQLLTLLVEKIEKVELTDQKYEEDQKKVATFLKLIDWIPAMQKINLNMHINIKLADLVNLENNKEDETQLIDMSTVLLHKAITQSSALEQKVQEFLATNSDLHDTHKSNLSAMNNKVKSGREDLNKHLEKLAQYKAKHAEQK